MKSMSSNGLKAIVGMAVLAVVGMASGAKAGIIYTTVNQPIPLTSLTGTGSSVEIGGLSFSNFAASFTNDMPTLSGVNVTPIVMTVDGGATTWGFELSGAFQDSMASIGGSDFILHYNVSAIDPAATQITDAHILGNTFNVGTGSGIVAETWRPTGGTAVTINAVYATSAGTQLSASTDFNGAFASLSVDKDIQLDAGTSGWATLSFVDQTYSTNASGGSQPGTPEPASLGILAIGATALLNRRRR